MTSDFRFQILNFKFGIWNLKFPISNFQFRISVASRALLACLVVVPSCWGLAGEMGSGKEPIYVGAQVCGQCHDGPAMGHQFSKWRLSAHARAYAALALPEAKSITELSGITEEPHKAKMCLGCHATASEAEEWEMLEGFHLEDGLQCEACHGPGSEYSSAEIMKDSMKAMANGLKMLAKEDCMNCHRAKGSHDMVLKKTPFSLDKAWAMIAHPTPGQEPPTAPIARIAGSQSSDQFLGVMACAKCHGGPDHGFQFSHWRWTKHSAA